MLYADRFATDAAYRAEVVDFDPATNGTEGRDRPLIVQFAANQAQPLLEAAKMIQHLCDAVDINLGSAPAVV